MKKVLSSLVISMATISLNSIVTFAEFYEELKLNEDVILNNQIQQIEEIEDDNLNEEFQSEAKLLSDNKYEQIKSLVSDLYVGFYKRDADEGGLNYWANEIYNSNKSVATVLLHFIDSEEYKSLNTSNKEYIIDIYKGLYSRYPDEGGLNYWINELNLGENRINLLSNIFNSQEFQNKLDTIGIDNKGHIEIQNDNGKIKALVSQLYEGLYNRKPDEGGLNYWSDQIAKKQFTVAQVLEQFTSSEEIKSKNYTNEEYVRCIYKTLLGREVDIDGLEYWTNTLNNGSTKKYVLSSCFNSQEFQSKLNSIGLTNKGSIDVDLIDKKGEVIYIINDLYMGFYGRSVDMNGANFWADQIIYNHKTVAQIVLDFINSYEFNSKNYSGEGYVKALYKGLLGRDADINGLNYWLNQLINGKTERYVLSCMFNSTEFKTKLQNIGITNIGEITLSSNDTKETVARGIIRSSISGLNLRSEPSLNSNVVTVLSGGDYVTITGRIKGDRTYYKVQCVKDGKVYSGYISITLTSGNTVEIFQDNVNNEFLGVLSEKYESNGDPGRISDTPGDYGGKSYGAWQFSSKMKSLDSFVYWLEDRNKSFYDKLTQAWKLDGNTNCGPNFDKAWKDIADNHYNTFYALQQAYVKENNYDKLVNKLLKVGSFSNVLSSFAGRNVLWSTVVQHGVNGAYNIIAPLKNITDVEEFITAVYAERGRTDENGILVYFKSSSIAVQQSVAKRFVNEKNEAIKLYRYSLS